MDLGAKIGPSLGVKYVEMRKRIEAGEGELGGQGARKGRTIRLSYSQFSTKQPWENPSALSEIN